jgi:DNA repair photolyase
MKRWGELKPVRFDEKELKTDLGENNFIFVGSSNDLFCDDNYAEWINDTIIHTRHFQKNQYLFQSKNPERMTHYLDLVSPDNTTFCTTIESNRDYFISKAPSVNGRAHWIKDIRDNGFKIMITIEPILDFDLERFVDLIRQVNPFQVNIGFNTSNIKLPEPSKTKTLELINEIQKFTKVIIKSNSKRILG